MSITEINEMINCLKAIIADNKHINIPAFRKKDSIHLKSANYSFTVDLNRAGHKCPKCTFQLRENKHKASPLVRLDLIGRGHPNPEGSFPYAGEYIPCPHIHIADENYGISIAYPLNEETAKMYLNNELLEDLSYVLKEFLKRINVANIDHYAYNYHIELQY